MKKITKIIVSFLMLFSITSCDLFSDGLYRDTEEIIELKEKGQFIEITYQEMLDKCEQGESFVYYIKSFDCYQCHLYSDEIVTVLNEDANKKIYCIIFENIEPEYLEHLQEISYNVLGEDYYAAQEWKQGSVYIPLTFQVVNGDISNAFCGFMAAKNLRYMYMYNFYNLDYFSNVVDKFDNVDNFTLHMSTASGDDENTYLDGLYTEYKNNPEKTQGYYFNLYTLSAEEKVEFIDLINSRIPDSMSMGLSELPAKFEIVVENKKIKSITVVE